MFSLVLLALAAGCTTVVADPQPPTNVRNAPNGTVVTTLGNGTELTVTDDRNGWLRVSSPATGWVHMSVTSVRCGSGDVMNTIVPNIRALAAKAKADQLAADTLVRFALGADGAPAEEASGGISDLMQANPTLLIAVLDQLSDTQRRGLLRNTLGANSDRPEAAEAFARAVAGEPAHPTSQTWRAMAQSGELP